MQATLYLLLFHGLLSVKSVGYQLSKLIKVEADCLNIDVPNKVTIIIRLRRPVCNADTKYLETKVPTRTDYISTRQKILRKSIYTYNIYIFEKF